ncbi:MAG: hypothetical protein ACTHOI_10190 [Sphingomicrobium sp.]
MIAALGTLPFLATLWLLVILGASALEESGAKIAAALKGKPCQPQLSYRKRARVRLPAQGTTRATPLLRAAA